MTTAMPGQPTDPTQLEAFAQSLGFGPRGTNPTTPPWEARQQPPQGSGLPNVGVRVNVPGLTSFSVGTKGASVDTKRLEKNVKDKVKGTLITWLIVGVIGFVVLLGLAGLGVYVFFVARSSTAPVAAGPAQVDAWDGKSPYTCTMGNHEIDGVTATAGVVASGLCHLSLKNVSITAPTAIDASGNAQVNVTGGSLSGSVHAIAASANAQVNTTGTTVTGKNLTSANGKINGAK